MSDKHSPGRIRYDFDPGFCGELIASDGTCVATFADEPSADDARRLVACWNACVSISTVNLEDNIPVRELARRYNAAIRQRDEVIGCFRAAETEGLSIALAETTDERLKDLVERRLMHALYACQPATQAAEQEGGAA